MMHTSLNRLRRNAGLTIISLAHTTEWNFHCDFFLGKLTSNLPHQSLKYIWHKSAVFPAPIPAAIIFLGMFGKFCIATCFAVIMLYMREIFPTNLRWVMRVNVMYFDIRHRFVHYNDVIMIAMASQISSLTIVYSIIYSRRRSHKISKLRVTGPCEGNSPVTSEFPEQRASNAGNVSIWWRHHSCIRNQHCRERYNGFCVYNPWIKRQ